MRAGPMRQRVQVQTLTETTDAYGQNVQSWNDGGTYWAEVKPLAGREAVNARQIKASVTHQFRMRFIGGLFPNKAISPSARLRFEGRLFNILWVPDIDYRHREYRILAEEIVAP